MEAHQLLLKIVHIAIPGYHPTPEDALERLIKIQNLLLDHATNLRNR